MNTFSLDNKHILLTGPTSGIGVGSASVLADAGARLLLVSRDEGRLLQTKLSLKNPDLHKILSGDLKNIRSFSSKLSEQEPFDGIVLNAGTIKLSPVQYFKEEDFDEIMDVNFKSTFYLCQQLIKHKKLKESASIVFISSVVSNKPGIGNSVYAASKGALNSFTRSLALELSKRKIRVNAILPGFVETELLNKTYKDKEQLSSHLQKYPLGRFGLPEDIAYLVQFLLSPQSSWLTGTCITLDGGFSLT